MNDWQGIFPQGPLPYQLPGGGDYVNQVSHRLGLLAGLADPRNWQRAMTSFPDPRTEAGRAFGKGLMGGQEGAQGIALDWGVNPMGLAGVPNLLGIFKGMNANLSPAETEMLAKAFELEQQGMGREAIRQTTNPPGGSGGWFRNPADRQWRIELDDSAAKVKDELTGLWRSQNLKEGRTVGEVFEHPGLFQAYPELAGARVQEIPESVGAGASWLQSRNLMELSPDFVSSGASKKGKDKLKSVFLHEVGGHGVQGREGFSTGTNAMMEADNAKEVFGPTMEKLNDLLLQNGADSSRLPMYDDVPMGGVTASELPYQYQRQDLTQFLRPEDLPRYEQLIDELDAAVPKYRGPYENYLTTGGEAEARLIEARRNLTPAQRLAIDPIEQMDTMLKSEGILGGIDDLITRYGDGPAMSAKAPIERYTGEVAYRAEPDDFVYHVTTAPKAKRIMDEGFNPKASKTVKGGFYENYSKDKVFFTDKDGLGFWRDRIEEHLDQAMDNPPDLVVLRVRKSDMPGLQLDDVGTKDARANSYFLPNEAQKQQGLLADTPTIPDELPFGYPERIEAFRKAREHAALPVEQGGLGLGPANTAAERAAAMGAVGETASDYGALHRPAMSDSGAPLYDMTGGGSVYPDDVYSYLGPRYYGHGENEAQDSALFQKIRGAKGKPDERVNIWRAVPDDVYKKYGTHINHGDWVTINKEYAKEHGEATLGGKYRLQGGRVPAKTLFTSGDSPYEWGLDRSQYFAEGPADIPVMRMTSKDGRTPITVERSKFAAFDPMKRFDPDLLASWLLPAAGMGLLGLGYLGQGEQTY